METITVSDKLADHFKSLKAEKKYILHLEGIMSFWREEARMHPKGSTQRKVCFGMVAQYRERQIRARELRNTILADIQRELMFS